MEIIKPPLFGFFALQSFIILSLGLVSFALCIAAEIKKSKTKDLRLDGELCYLPGSDSFGLGIGALICLFIAQMMGSFMVCWKLICLDHRSSWKLAKRPAVATMFLVLSWISFGITAVLLGTAASMSRTQPFGKGWVDSDCYIIKDGIYGGSGILVLAQIAFILVLDFLIIRKSHGEEGPKVHGSNCTRGSEPITSVDRNIYFLDLERNNCKNFDT